MSSAVDIVNQALLQLGSTQIISFDDELVEASAAKALYPTAKKQVLRSYPWRCATANERLALSAKAPIDPAWEYQHAIPDDSIRIIQVMSVADSVGFHPSWVIEGEFIMSNEKNISAKYIRNISEPKLDAHVEMAIIARVAFDMCYTLTASQSLQTSLYQLYEAKLNEARITDRQEGSHKKFQIDALDVVRR
jgi:hypothetical protein